MGKLTYCFLFKGVTMAKTLSMACDCERDTVVSVFSMKFEFFKFSEESC